MSWIKRLLQMFSGEEGETKHSEPPRVNNIERQRHYSEQNKTEPKKEVEARVLYKYPKGQFKFPLIPDAEVKRTPEPKKVRRSVTWTETGTSKANEKPIEPMHEKPIEPMHEKPKVKPNTPISNLSRQPFRRTEIPSPIFAFNRPKSDEIEYELNGFMQDESAKAIAKRSVQESVNIAEEAPEKVLSVAQKEEQTDVATVPQEEAEIVVATEAREEEQVDMAEVPLGGLAKIVVAEEAPEEVQADVVEELQEAPTPIVVTEETSKEEQADEVEELQEAPAPIVVAEETSKEEQADEVEELQEAPASIVVAEEASEEEQTDVVEGVQEKPVPIVVTEEASEEDQADVVEGVQEKPVPIVVTEEASEEDQADVVEAVQEAPASIVVAEEASEEEQADVTEVPQEEERTVVAEEVQKSASNEVDEENLTNTIEDVPVAATLEAVPERKKRQLPFNVLMLKQDKRKLEEQKNNIADTILQKFNPVQTSQTPIVKEMDKKEETEAKSIEEENVPAYEFPPLNLLQPPVIIETNQEWLENQEFLLNETLKNFNVGARVVNVTQGPAVTRFEVQPEPGVKVNKITNLSDDIKLSLAARDIRIEAPIPGKHTIGIEVPNETSRPVLISEILQKSGFSENPSPLAVALGLDIAGTPVVTDLKKMPHGLIAGATGSGKSVCINTMLISLLYKAHPNDVKLLLIDPKMVELAPYNHIPHLVSPVITDVKAATASLKWAVEEMERRYELFAHTGVRDIGRFNEIAMEHKRYSEKLPYIVIVIDELADLMMMSPADVEEAICRIAQKARACGIHLIIATQRPSVDVITGLIKANVPTRVAFSVSSQVDSRTIIDISGAEKLLGRGDMLFLENGSSKPFRLQGTFVSDQEIDEIVAFVREQRAPEYLFEQDELIKKTQITEDEDELFYEACLFVIEQGGASSSSLQRRFKVGYNRAARLIDMMEQNGFISEGRGSKPRDVLITMEDLDFFQENHSLT